MINIAKLDKNDFKTIILNTSNKINIQPSIVEKDFWVCYVLDYLFNRSIWKNAFVFKGGTSLSKAFNIINRFSEDIDLILDWNLINYDTDELWLERSHNQQNKLNEKIISDASIFLENRLIPTMKEDLKKELGFDVNIEMDDNDLDRCTVNFYYPNLFNNNYTRSEIRLEIGPLAEWLPSHNVEISSYIAQIYTDIFKQPNTNIRTVDVERTFWEKISILHTIASGYKNGKVPRRYARHYYDVYCLANSIVKNNAFKRKELLKDDITFKMKFYYSASASYETAVIGSIKLIPSEDVIEKLKKDYNDMKDMFFTKIPKF